MSKMYVFLLAILLNFGSLNVYAQEFDSFDDSNVLTEENSERPKSFEQTLWTYLNLQKDDGNADTLDWSLEEWINRIQHRKTCYESLISKDSIEELLKSENLKHRVERALREEAKRKGREEVRTLGIAGISMVAGLLSIVLFYFGTKLSGYKSASCGSLSGGSALASLAFLISYLLKRPIDEDTPFREPQEVIDCLRELLKRAETDDETIELGQ